MKTVTATVGILLCASLLDSPEGLCHRDNKGLCHRGNSPEELSHQYRWHRALALSAAELPDASLAADIEKQGGHVVRDAKGNIVEVSLARTWATDADVERVAAIKTLKKLDLSLTYVSDKGAEAIGKATQLEELNLFTAEFITDAAIAFLRGN